jgi:hypothetical protein
MTSKAPLPHNACRLCGATSYRRLTHRSEHGAMGYSGLYRCSGCELTFESPSLWRGDAQDRRATVNVAHALRT